MVGGFYSRAPIDARLEVQVRMSITITERGVILDEKPLAILAKSRFRDARLITSFQIQHALLLSQALILSMH